MIRTSMIRAAVAASVLIPLAVSAQVSFRGVTTVTMPNTPYELAKGDLNNDGRQDVVSCNFNSFAGQQVTVMLNTGSGTFTGAAIKSFSAATNVNDVAVGDFNEDGNLDVVVCSQLNANFSLLTGDGAGNLAAPVHFAAGDNPQGIAVGDMNKDNNLDVLVTNRGTPADLRIYLGNGAGGFAAPAVIPVTNIWDVAVADFNSDTNPDVALYVNSTVQVWYGNGSGTAFTLNQTIASMGLSDDVDVADLNNDGAMDVYTNRAYAMNAGTGTFAAAVLLSQPGEEMMAGDLNNDGNPDFAQTDYNVHYPNMRIYLGNGTGTFTLLAKFETSVYARGIQMLDVNNDSKIDLVGVGSDGSLNRTDVLIGEGNGYFESVIKYPVTADPRDMVKGDFNEDGSIDIALCHSTGSSNNVTIYLGLGQGKFAKTPASYTAASFPQQIISIDYNKDAHADLVTFNQNTSSSVTVFTGDGTGQFTSLPPIGVATTMGRITAADFNNDTNIDLVVSGGTGKAIHLLTGTGSGFNAPSVIPVSADIFDVKAADFDGNGNQDIAATFINDNKFVVLFGNGAGAFTEGTQYNASREFVEVYDLNNDSKPDVIVHAGGVTGKDIFINNGTGTFTASVFNPPLSLKGLGYADMDGDGVKDLVVGSQNSISSSSGLHRIYKGSASGTFGTLIYTKNYSGGNSLVTHDVNGDGKMDIITTSFNIYEDYLAVMINNTSACAPPSVSALSSDVSACAGTSVTLSVTAGGAGAFSYQWRRNTVSISGATSASLTMPAVAAANAGSYTVTITNACGTITSNAITLAVSTVSPPAVSGAGRCDAGTVTLTASGTTDGNYRWYTTSSGDAPLAGEVNGAFTTPPLAATTAYFVSIHNGTCESARTPVTATIGGATCSSNQPPVIEAATLTVLAEGTVSVDLLPLITDADNNVDISSLQIIQPPQSGAQASISGSMLTIAYAGVAFSGTENLEIGVCDLLGSCVQQQLSIEVTEGILVYNGISPDGDQFNAAWQIRNIALLPGTRKNKVTIYNRWGDEVYTAADYNNTTTVFTGVGKNGNALPSGTYFYKIEFLDYPSKTGYLVIKR